MSQVQDIKETKKIKADVMALKFTLVKKGGGQDVYSVKAGSEQVREALQQQGVPYNKIYFGGGKTFVKVPSGAFKVSRPQDQPQYVDPLGQGVSIDPSLVQPIETGMSIKTPFQPFKTGLETYVRTPTGLREDIRQPELNPVHPTLKEFSYAERKELASYPLSSFLEKKQVEPLPSHPGAAAFTWIGKGAVSAIQPFVKGSEFIAKGPLALKFTKSYIDQPYKEKQRLAQLTASETASYAVEHPFEFGRDIAIGSLLLGPKFTKSPKIPTYKITMLKGIEFRQSLGIIKAGKVEQLFGKKAVIPHTYEITSTDFPKLMLKDYEFIGTQYVKGFAERGKVGIDLTIKRDLYKPVGEPIDPGSNILKTKPGGSSGTRPYILKDISTPPPAPEPIRKYAFFDTQSTKEFVEKANSLLGSAVPSKGPRLTGKPPIQRLRLKLKGKQKFKDPFESVEPVAYDIEQISTAIPKGFGINVSRSGMSQLLKQRYYSKTISGTSLKERLIPKFREDVFTGFKPKASVRSKLLIETKPKQKLRLKEKLRPRTKYKFKEYPEPKLGKPKGKFFTLPDDDLFKIKKQMKLKKVKKVKAKRTKLKTYKGVLKGKRTGLSDIVLSAVLRRPAKAAAVFRRKRK